MTSVLRGFRDVKQGLTKFMNLQTPAYYDDSVNEEVPIPFMVTDGVLDIHIQDEVQEDCIDDGEYDDDYPDFQCRQLGNLQNVTSLGPKFLEWMRNVIENIEDDGTYTGPITLVVKPIMIDVQYTTDGEDWDGYGTLESEGYFGNSLNAPNSDNYITGDPSNNYRKVSVFKTPLTISYLSTDISPGQLRYITLNTGFDGD
jgi:hypothetical protein